MTQRMLAEFARLLGIPLRQSEDALHSEPAAKLVVSRRLFIGASAAGVAALMLKPGEVERAMVTSCSRTARAQLSSVHLLDQFGNVLRRWYPGERIRQIDVFNDDERWLNVRVVRVTGRFAAPVFPLLRWEIPPCRPEWRYAVHPGHPYGQRPGVVWVSSPTELIIA